MVGLTSPYSDVFVEIFFLWQLIIGAEEKQFLIRISVWGITRSLVADEKISIGKCMIEK